jgi:hypothetical protein
LGGCSQIFGLRRERPVPAKSKVSFPLSGGILAIWTNDRFQPVLDDGGGAKHFAASTSAMG